MGGRLLEIHTGFDVGPSGCFTVQQAEVCVTGLTPAKRDILQSPSHQAHSTSTSQVCNDSAEMMDKILD